jgi:hypothetical protein
VVVRYSTVANRLAINRSGRNILPQCKPQHDKNHGEMSFRLEFIAE